MQENLDRILEKPIIEPAPVASSSMPIKLPLKLGPTPDYLAVSHSPSVRFHTHAPRKLLILDLNGTLLLRSKSGNAKHRPIYPRPYMPAFCSYLFHDAVIQWLEAMVWSSAQPHSVNDMVECCFGDHKGGLKAVWARDTLGLSKADYSRKVQTTKDLEKLWSAAPSLSPHSAETTLLLNDSALKAHLQPYNHFCVPEYTKNLRNCDLNIKESLERRKELPEKDRVEAQVKSAFQSLELVSVLLTTKKLQHTKRKLHADFNPILIAVIGVLDEVKGQTNVAGWIRAGGLWAGHMPEHSAYHKQDGRRGGFSLTGEKCYTRSRKKSNTRPSPNPGNDGVLGEDEAMWFKHAPSLHYWVDRGSRALEALGNELDHGILR